MDNYSILDSICYQNKSFVIQSADYILKPLRVALNAREIDVDSDETEEKVHQIGMRIFSGFIACLTFPISLIGLTVKWWKKAEWQNAIHEANERKEMALEEEDEVLVPEDREEFVEFLQKEFALVQHLNKKLPDPVKGSWRAYGEKHGEYDQTFANYVDAAKGIEWPDQRPLYIQRIGTFSKTDLKIIAITCDYLRIFHQIPLEIRPNILTIDKLKEDFLKVVAKNSKKARNTKKKTSPYKNLERWYKYIVVQMKTGFPRKDGQYNGSVLLDIMSATTIPSLKKEGAQKPQLIAFTDQDLYDYGLENFVFGVASLMEGVGVWSNARFGNPKKSSKSFETSLLRMMKISAHEFGHMRGLPHCTDYECNIGGYMSATELDNRPLLYCLQDTAKICYLTHTSLLQHHKKLLGFFQNFNKKYQLNYDFSKEIRVLKKRIAVLRK